MKGLHLSIAVLLTAVLVATGIFVSGVVQASHSFSDVPTGAFYHNAVEWVFNRGITAGCAAGLYCPDANVTRGQMAVFLQKEGQVLSLTRVSATGAASGVNIDLDAGGIGPSGRPVICPTTSNYVPTYPQRALVTVRVSIVATATGGNADYWVFPVVSTDGGTSFISVGADAWSVETRADSVHHPNFSYDSFDLVPVSGGGPTSGYRFGAALYRATGSPTTGDIGAYRCATNVEIFNRNPISSPLAPTP